MTIEKQYIGPHIAESDIEAFERRIRRKLPHDYRTFLLRYNGGVPSDHKIGNDSQGDLHIQLFYGIRSDEGFDIESINERMSGRWPERFLAIAIDDFGNRFILSLAQPDNESIYFWDHEEEAEEGEPPTEDNLYLIATSFTRFWLCLVPVEPGAE